MPQALRKEGELSFVVCCVCSFLHPPSIFIGGSHGRGGRLLQLILCKPTYASNGEPPRGRAKLVGHTGNSADQAGRPASQWAHRPSLLVHEFLPGPTCHWLWYWLLSCRFLALVGPLLHILTCVGSSFAGTLCLGSYHPIMLQN